MLKGSILEKLVTNRTENATPIQLGVYYKNTLVALCHALENFILESYSAPLMITAFQKGKWYLQEAGRYAELAEKAEQIIILAEPSSGFENHPTSQLNNVELVGLSLDDPVTQEWHLIIISPTYTAMVLCQELSEADYEKQGQPSHDLERKFYGFWTFEPELVLLTTRISLDHIATYNPILSSQVHQQIHPLIDSLKTSQRDDITTIISRIIDALQESQQQLLFSQPHLDNNLISNELQAFLRMAQLISQVDPLNPKAGEEVGALVEIMGQFLDLPAWQIKRLQLAGWLHRLSPLQGIIPLPPLKTEMQYSILQQQGLFPKASVMRMMPQLQAISQIITHHTEHWDGTGEPDGLAYDMIPLESRILGLIIDFQRQVTLYEKEENLSPENALVQALTDCQKESGVAYDPKLIETLSLMVMMLQQGMTLPSLQPKITGGIWLLDS